MSNQLTNLRAVQANRAYQALVQAIPAISIIEALSNLSNNQKLGIEHRGLWQTDKRFTEETGIEFVGQHPHCSVFDILRNRPASKKAVYGRAKTSKLILPSQYERSLIIRNIRGQILNPILRVDAFLKFANNVEYKRAIAMRPAGFIRLAADPTASEFVKDQIN